MALNRKPDVPVTLKVEGAMLTWNSTQQGWEILIEFTAGEETVMISTNAKHKELSRLEAIRAMTPDWKPTSFPVVREGKMWRMDGEPRLPKWWMPLPPLPAEPE